MSTAKTLGVNSAEVRIAWDSSDRTCVLSTSVTLHRPRNNVFGFFADAFQLELITRQWLNFQILTQPPLVLRQGSLIDYKIVLHGLPIRWRTEISSWNPPFSFTDRQLRGPYQLWEHCHTFEECAAADPRSGAVR